MARARNLARLHNAPPKAVAGEKGGCETINHLPAIRPKGCRRGFFRGFRAIRDEQPCFCRAWQLKLRSRNPCPDRGEAARWINAKGGSCY